MATDRPKLNALPFNQWKNGIHRPLLIAGPCSAESEAQVLRTALAIKEHAPQVQAFRAGVWKPRTRPGTFEGIGAVALEWMQQARERTGLALLTEVATPDHVEQCLEAGMDMLWIGARTTPNPFSVQAIADALRGVDIPVLVKNPINPDLDLWVGALERIAAAGITKLVAVHRGFSWSGQTKYRNHPMWEFPIRLKTAFPDLEVICDPSHIAGRPEFVGGISQSALNLNCSGLMIETHIEPDAALSDKDQQLAPKALGELLRSLNFPEPSATGVVRDRLHELRDQIDQLDHDIMQKLAERLDIAERIGEYKRDHNVAILQPERWDAIMKAQQDLGQDLGASEHFIEAFMNAIHQESIERQTAVRKALVKALAGSRS